MRRVGLVVLAVLCIILQFSLLPALRPFGVVPDLALVLVVLVGLEGTASTALIIGVAGGIVLDLVSGANFGLWTGTLVVAALTTGLLHRAGVELVGPLVAMAMVSVGTFMITAVVLLGLANTVSHWPVAWLAGQFITELVLNLILTVALRPLVKTVASSSTSTEFVIG
jgi:rod shape-determining protein MreD